MKRQDNIFDYDTGSVIQETHKDIPQDFQLEKPAQATVDIDLIGETFEQRLVRLGKIAAPEAQSYEKVDTPEGYTLVFKAISRRKPLTYGLDTEVRTGRY